MTASKCGGSYVVLAVLTARSVVVEQSRVRLIATILLGQIPSGVTRPQ